MAPNVYGVLPGQYVVELETRFRASGGTFRAYDDDDDGSQVMMTQAQYWKKLPMTCSMDP